MEMHLVEDNITINFKVLVVNVSDSDKYLSTIAQYTNKKFPVLIVAQTDKLTIFYTGKNDMNLQKVEHLGGYIIPYPSNGGTAISNIGDLGFYFGIPGNHGNWCQFVFSKVKLWLQTLGIQVQLENNDLTLHGRKVMGYTQHPGQTYSNGSIFVAMANSQQLVNEICLKPKTRITTGLASYGITASEVIEVVIKATTNYIASIETRKET